MVQDGAHGGRRRLLRGAMLAAAGAGVGAAAFAELADAADRHLPIRGGAASATVADRRRHPGAAQLCVRWHVECDQKLVALTFDDGPRPQWTDVVLDILHRHGAPATLFTVGRRVRKYARVLAGRVGRHEVANHSWDHRDLARMDADEVYEDLRRTHDAIGEVTGQTARLVRPPYGHLGGSTLLAASRLGYEVVLWSGQMLESEYPDDPAGHAAYVVAQAEPGAILLAHDTGPPDRLVAIRGLPDMITGMRSRGFEFVTVSELLAAAHPGAA
ncbi:MAG TPA: polysaccharide deacetylase family protein [Pilimelia sp.]|nr:polysaccharide deacetylase family protein [Pilimelia sp.]